RHTHAIARAAAAHAVDAVPALALRVHAARGADRRDARPAAVADGGAGALVVRIETIADVAAGPVGTAPLLCGAAGLTETVAGGVAADAIDAAPALALGVERARRPVGKERGLARAART